MTDFGVKIVNRQALAPVSDEISTETGHINGAVLDLQQIHVMRLIEVCSNLPK